MNIDAFSRNIILVFLGSTAVNVFNLLYQLLIAHRLSPADFAGFNSLIFILTLVATPLATFQTVVAKYVAEFKSREEKQKINFLFASLLKKNFIFAVLTFIIFYSTSFLIIDRLKIPSFSSGYILAILLALAWIIPVCVGVLQGLELFKWYNFVSVTTGGLKLIFALIFIWLGFGISGALGALLLANVFCLAVCGFILKDLIALRTEPQAINFKEFYCYAFPVALSTFFYMLLVGYDLYQVRISFSPEQSGIYSLAQMVGKILLFLPVAISVVILPKTSGLNAQNQDTRGTLKRGLLYAAVLCISAILVYNIFPEFVLKVLTGKTFHGSVILGRFFSVSMTFFALLLILITYFISIKDLRFIKYLVIFTLLQVLTIIFFHNSLIQIQLIMCVYALVLFLILLAQALKK